jgi:hypothetical protein
MSNTAESCMAGWELVIGNDMEVADQFKVLWSYLPWGADEVNRMSARDACVPVEIRTIHTKNTSEISTTETTFLVNYLYS